MQEQAYVYIVIEIVLLVLQGGWMMGSKAGDSQTNGISKLLAYWDQVRQFTTSTRPFTTTTSVFYSNAKGIGFTLTSFSCYYYLYGFKKKPLLENDFIFMYVFRYSLVPKLLLNFCRTLQENELGQLLGLDEDFLSMLRKR